MSLSSDNFAASIYLKNQVKKWKNIAFLILFCALLFFSRMFLSDNNIEDGIEIGKDYIANITIDGIIIENDYRDKILHKIAEQKNIKAVIVNVNSPGGSIVGSEILYNELCNIAKNKPIIVVMNSLAASGGYMISLASDYIIAHNGTLTGSIGVIMESAEITDLANKVGVKFLNYKSSPLKGAPSPFEKTNPQTDKIINESIKDSYDFFSSLVLERRKGKLKTEEINKAIDGRVFTGRQALKAGLVDEIGGKKEALAYLQKYHKIDINKIEEKDISLEKSEGQFLGKFFGLNLNKILNQYQSNGQLMSIWKL